MKRISRKRIKQEVRITVLICLIALFVFSTYTTYAAFQKEEPIVKEKVITVCNYEHTGNFNYVVYLKNNSLYGSATIGPGDIIFKNITDHIDASFSYRFSSDRKAKVRGDYELSATVKTDLWSKNFVIIPKTDFNSSSFRINFPLNISRFDSVVNQIDKELAVRSKKPELIMRCTVHTVAETDAGTIDEFFAHSLVVPLRESVININSNLSASKPGSIKRTEKVVLPPPPAAAEKKQKSLASTIAIGFVFIAFALLTESEQRKIDRTEKIVKGIKKKYSDWIVDSDEAPSAEKIIPLNSIEDLMKVAEDLGKPVIHTSIREGEHLYFVFDGSTQYKYVLGEGKM